METNFASTQSPKKQTSRKSWIILILVILVVAGGAYAVFTMMPTVKTDVVSGENPVAPVGGEPAGESEYQAIFLTTGQAYFGKIVGSMTGQYVEMEDIYYLQTQQPLQQNTKDKKPADQPSVSLVKFGGELHGPTDQMWFNRDNILVIQNLRVDSNVVKTIENYKKANAPTQ